MLLFLCLIPLLASLVLVGGSVLIVQEHHLGFGLGVLFTAIPLFIYSIDLTFQVF